MLLAPTLSPDGSGAAWSRLLTDTRVLCWTAVRGQPEASLL